MNCHCGSPLDGSDHCPFCGCEQYESTCNQTYEGPKARVFLQRHIDALTAVVNDYQLDSYSWKPEEVIDFDEAVGILNGYLVVNFGGEVVDR